MNFNLHSLMLGWLSALVLLWLVVSWSKANTIETEHQQIHPILQHGNTAQDITVTAQPSFVLHDQSAAFKNHEEAAGLPPIHTDRQYRLTHSLPGPLAMSRH